MKIPRVYLDTSAVGGCEDEEFQEGSLALFQDAKAGHIRLLVSDHLLMELSRAPEKVRKHLTRLPADCFEAVEEDADCRRLRDRYLEAGVVGSASAADALHVAIATVANAEVIASWNFKHIVHYDKARLFNAVNLQQGYGMIDIRTPREVASI